MTTAATLDPGAPLHNTMGSMLLGVILSAVLYGISALQVFYYFTRYARDPLHLRVLVAITLFLDTVHLAFVTHTIYHYLIVNYYNHDALQIMVWSVSLEALPTGVTAGLVQSFYAYRVWKLSHRSLLLTGSIMVLVMATAGCGTAWVVLALQATTYEHLLRITPLTITINALSTGADLIITGTLCIMLHYTRPAFLRTETMINKLILFTINTGLLTSCCAVASLISLILSRKTLIYALFYFCIGRLYSNALVASLNARSDIQGRVNNVDINLNEINHPNSASGSRGGTISRNVFVHQPSKMEPHELSIHVNRETRMYGDASLDDKGDAPPSDDKVSQSGNASTATLIREA